MGFDIRSYGFYNSSNLMIIRGVLNSTLFTLILIISLTSFSIHSETRLLSNKYLTTELSTKNGLPQNTVYSITTDKKGFIWIGTDRGVSRFDGINFRNFNMYNSPEIRNNSVTSLLTKKDGTMLIGTYGGGIVTYGTEQFAALDLGPGSHSYKIWQMLEDSKNNLWILTSGNELIRLDSRGNTKKYLLEKGHGKLSSLIETSSKDILVATEKSILRIKNDKVSAYHIKNFPQPSVILSIRSYDPDEILICTDKGLLKCSISPGIIELLSRFENQNVIRDTFRDSGGNTWIISDRGLKKLEEGKVIQYIAEDRFFQSPLLSMFEGAEGNLWIGSSGRGLRILRKRVFFSHQLSPEGFIGQVNSICEFDGTLAAGTQNNGLLITRADRYFSFSLKEGLSSNTVNTVLFHNKRILAGTNNGLSIITPLPVKNQNPKIVNILPGTEILSLITLSDNTVLIGTRGDGLYTLEQYRGVKYGKGQNTPPYSIFTIFENHDRTLLLGTDQGIIILNRDTLTVSTLPGTEMVTGPVYDIFEDLDRSIWIGSKDLGLLILKKNTLIQTGRVNNTLLTPVFRIIEGRNKKIWMSTNNGILMLGKNDVYKYIRKISDTLNPVLYSQNDGITIPVFSGGTQPAGSISREGIIYYPTREGVTRFDSASFPINTRPPSIIIRRLLADKSEYPIYKPIVLSHVTKNITIRYSIISFSSRNKVIAKIEMTGNGKKWHPHSFTSEQIEFKDLSPGKYRVRITAANNDRVWNHKGVSLLFRIRNPFHTTLPFYLLLIAFLYLVSPFIYRKFLNTRKKKAREAGQKYKDSNLTTVDSHIYFKKLKQLMENDKLYLDPNLKIRDISSRMGIPRKVLSQLINDVLGENFKHFINRYRIEEAIKRLTDPGNRDFVLLKIIYEAGFNSKSVFNTTFKKHTGMTPSEFRKKNISR